MEIWGRGEREVGFVTFATGFGWGEGLERRGDSPDYEERKGGKSGKI